MGGPASGGSQVAVIVEGEMRATDTFLGADYLTV